MENGRLHEPVLYPRGSSQRYPLNRRRGRPYSLSELRKENNLLLTEIEPRFSRRPAGGSILLTKRYNSCRVLAFSTVFFHSRRSWPCSDHLRSSILLRSFLTSSFHLCLGLPTGRVTYGYHLYIFLTMLVSGFLCMCPNQLSLWGLT